MNDIRIEGEPQVVYEIRKKILTEFDDLRFDPIPHKYYIGEKELPSVSHVAHQFQEETDFGIVAERYAQKEAWAKETPEKAQLLENCDVPAKKVYAEKNGMTKEYWLDQWKFNNLKATTTGTSVHEYGESLGWLRNGHPELITEENKVKYIADKGWLIPTRNKEEAVLKFWDELPPNLHFVLAETKVYSNKGEASNVNTQFAGTFDLLFYYLHPTDDSKSGLVIWDYKTNKSLISYYNRDHNKTLLEPFNHMVDEPLSLYTLQLSLYALCLRGIGLNVIGNRIIWLQEDCNYAIEKLQDLSTEEWFKKSF